MIKPEKDMSNMDVALTEVAEGKLQAEVASVPVKPESDNIIQM